MPPKAKSAPRGAPPPPSSSSGDDDDGGDVVGRGGMFDLTKFTNTNYSREFMATLPVDIRKRTEVLLSYDADYVALQQRIALQRDALRRDFESACVSLFQRRRELVVGVPATDAEVLQGKPEGHEEVDVQLPAAAPAESYPVPKFWLEALQHHVVIDELITERDAAVLEYLVDITSVTLDPASHGGLRGFTVVFHFAPNPHLATLTMEKTLLLKEDGEVERTTETPAVWKTEASNPTVVITSKKVKAKRGPAKFVKSEEPCPSFFTIFQKSDDLDEMEQHYALLSTIRDKVVPLAVEYFTGEAPDGSSDIEDFSDDEEEEDEEEEEDDEPPMPPPPTRGGGKKGAPQNAPRKTPAAAAPPPKAPGRGRGGKQPPDCKQQ